MKHANIDQARAIAKAALGGGSAERRTDAPLSSSAFSFPKRHSESSAKHSSVAEVKGSGYVLHGVVVDDKQDRVVIVKVERAMKKSGRRFGKFKAIDDGNSHKIGDHVMIQELLPQKTWIVIADGAQKKSA